MLLGGWGVRAADAVERLARERGLRVERVGGLVVAGPASAGDACVRWWLSGRLDGDGPAPASSAAPGDTRSAAADPALALARAGHDLPHALARLRGAFALAALDVERGRGWLVRDPLGARTLAWARLGDGVAFAEHERDLLALLPATPAPDRLAVAQWIARRTLPLGRSLWEGVHRLPPGCRLALTPREARVERSWTPAYESPPEGSSAQHAQRLREAAFAAVARSAAGPRTVALRLSGGLDSACVAAGLSACAPDAYALAVVFPDAPEVDEEPLLAQTAAHCGLALERIPFDGARGPLPAALEQLERWRLPPGSPNAFVWEPLTAAARAAGVEALLDGEGGDELFGLAPGLIADRLAHARAASAWRLTGRLPGMGAGSEQRLRLRLRALRRFGLAPLLPDALRRRRAVARAEVDPGLLPASDARALAERDDDALGGLDGPLWWRRQLDALVHGAEALDVHGQLRREALDGCVERRHPFLHDVALLEAALAVPPQLQFEPARDRPLLRDALAGRVPEAILRRDAKASFTSLSLRALDGAQGELLATRLRRPDAPIRGHVRADALEALLAQHERGLAPRAATSFWQLATTDLWLAASADPAALDELRDALAGRTR